LPHVATKEKIHWPSSKVFKVYRWRAFVFTEASSKNWSSGSVNAGHPPNGHRIGKKCV
jgi:hypothetical protein